MKRAFLQFCILLALCTALADAVPVRFRADAERPQAFQAAAYRGETLAVEAALTLRGAPLAVADGASATMHWQTNGMGAAWWTAPASVTTAGVVRATWTPAMDCGADAYRIFLGVADGGSNLNYRANMLLRMIGSPGETPNALPLPTPHIDFSLVSVTNAPWTNYTAGANITISNGVISATGGGGGTLTVETDPVFGEWARTNAVLPRLSIDEVYNTLELSGNVSLPEGHFSAALDIDAGGDITAEAALIAGTMVQSPLFVAPTWDGFTVAAEGSGRGTSISEMYENIELDIAAQAAAAESATRSWTLSTYGSTNAWMAIDGDLLGIYTCTNSAAGTNTLWESSSAMGGQLAGVALRATNNTTRITALEARPDLTSWGDYAPDGTPNPDAEAMVYLNKALTLMGSGFSWATSGSYACLCQSGAVAFQVETNGEIRIGTDVQTNYFGLVQGGSVTVGCRTDGISVADGVAYLDYAYAGGAFPVIWFCGDLVAGAWQETTPVWTDNGDGTATAAVPATGSRGFYKATSSRQTGAYFHSNVPAHFPSGIYGSLAAEPVKYDSVITVQSGGHTYRIPAELVQ